MTKKRFTVYLNLDMAETITTMADNDFRTPPQQIAYIVNSYLNRKTRFIKDEYGRYPFIAEQDTNQEESDHDD